MIRNADQTILKAEGRNGSLNSSGPFLTLILENLFQRHLKGGGYSECQLY